MENPVRKLRKAIGLSQEELATRIGRSYQSVRNYERSLQRVPSSVIDKLKRLAVERGYPDLADQLSSCDLEAIDTPAFNRDGRPERSGDRERWHNLLDEVLGSGAEDAIAAVQHSLLVAASYVSSKRGARVPKPKG